MRSASRSTKVAWMSECTISREVEPHDWPWKLKFMPRTTPSSAASRSASGKITIGFLPPHSSVTVFTATPAARAWIARPVSARPMNAIRGTSGCATSASPASAP